MERIFISHFSFSIAEQIQFWTITTPSNAHTHTNRHQYFLRWPKRTSQAHSCSQRFPPSFPNRQDPITSPWLLSHSKAAANTVVHIATWKSQTYPQYTTISKIVLEKFDYSRLLNKSQMISSFFFLKRAGTLQQALLIELTQIHVVIIGNYLSISNVLMSLRCERQRNQELLA